MRTEHGQVFISHVSADAAKAKTLERVLAKRGHTVWTDRQISPGSDWLEEIENAVAASQAFVLLLSPKYLNSDWANFETGLALAREAKEHTPVLPILLEDIDVERLPFRLRRMHTLDGRRLDAEAIAEQIDQAIERTEG